MRHDIDVVIVYSPPLPLGLLGAKVKKIYGAKYLLNIQDIFPQNAIDLGIMKNPFIIKVFERMESKIYQSSDYITTHTKMSAQFLIERKKIPIPKISTNPVAKTTIENMMPEISAKVPIIVRPVARLFVCCFLLTLLK